MLFPLNLNKKTLKNEFLKEKNLNRGRGDERKMKDQCEK